MDGKYIIILLFIFLVFLMGSINSTVTNNFYNNTTGSQDHAVLSNLSYADSNHTGFQSSSSLDTDISALGYVTNAYHDNEKVNKSGDNITGDMDFGSNNITNLSGIVNQDIYKSIDINPTTNSINFNKINSYVAGTNNNSTVTNNIHKFSFVFGHGQDSDLNANNLVQFWTVSNSSNSTTNFFQGYRSRGYYDTVNSKAVLFPVIRDDILFRIVGAGMRNTTLSGSQVLIDFTADGNWTDSSNPTRLDFGITKNNSLTVQQTIRINETGLNILSGFNLSVAELSGSGNAYDCLDSTGKQYRGTPLC